MAEQSKIPVPQGFEREYTDESGNTVRAEPVPRMIINGPQHGCPLDTEHEDGTIIHTPVTPPLRQYSDEVDVRFMFPRINQKYLLMGKYAYYLGEEVHPLDLS